VAAILLALALLAAGCGGGSGTSTARSPTTPTNPGGGGGGGGGNGSVTMPSVEDVYTAALSPYTNFDEANTVCSTCYRVLRLSPPGSADGETNIFVRYRLDSVPQGAIVASAHVTLVPSRDVASSGDRLAFSVYAVSGTWRESSLMWDTMPGYEAIASGTGSIDGSQFVLDVPIDVDLVQSWIEAPAFNYGLVLVPDGNGTGATRKIMASREGDNTGISLEITYTVP
jgi:hypothetical protein